MTSSALAASASGASWSLGAVSNHWAKVPAPSGPAAARVLPTSFVPSSTSWPSALSRPAWARPTMPVPRTPILTACLFRCC